MIKALKVVNTLRESGLIRGYAIGGGYALNYYLEPILTFDLDIFILIDTEKDYSILYEHFRRKRYKIESLYVVIGGLPVRFLPSYISPLIEEAKRIRIRGTYTKILKVEHLIATLLVAFRPKDRMVIPQLIEQADMKLLKNIIKRFSDEKTPLDKRLARILESIR